jgi:hypothetical protein
VIRQAISCDICGAEKKQTNHWFVAYEQGQELRLCGWNTRLGKRPGSMHLCGQKCLHKLVDDFMARAVAVRLQPTEGDAVSPARPTDTSLTGPMPRPETPLPMAMVAPALPPLRMQPGPATARAQSDPGMLPGRPEAAELTPLFDEPPRYASRNWRTEAWEREREREMRAGEPGPNLVTRR